MAEAGTRPRRSRPPLRARGRACQPQRPTAVSRGAGRARDAFGRTTAADRGRRCRLHHPMLARGSPHLSGRRARPGRDSRQPPASSAAVDPSACPLARAARDDRDLVVAVDDAGSGLASQAPGGARGRRRSRRRSRRRRAASRRRGGRSRRSSRVLAVVELEADVVGDAAAEVGDPPEQPVGRAVRRPQADVRVAGRLLAPPRPALLRPLGDEPGRRAGEERDQSRWPGPRARRARSRG